MIAAKYVGIRVFLISLTVFFFCSSVCAEEWYKSYEKAEEAIQAGEWETAIDLLEKVIEDDPTPKKDKKTYGMHFIDYSPYLKLGQAYLAIEKMKEAQENCQKAKEKGAAPEEAVEFCLKQTVAWTSDPSHVFVADEAASEKGKIIDLSLDVEQRSENVYAVIIGIDEYQDKRIPPLQYTVNDAQRFYDILTDPLHRGVKEEQIKLLLGQEATYGNIKKAIGTWLKKQAEEEDTVIIYYSGHGAPDGEKTYWVTYNADIDDLYSTALNNNEIADMLDSIKSKRIITFLDSCYSEATVNRTGQTRNVITEIPLEKFTGEGRVVISASDGKQQAVELDEYQHGAFTYYLLEGLKREADANNDNVVVVDEIWDYVKDRVSAAAQKVGNPQTPVLQGRITAGIPLTVVISKTTEEKLAELLKVGLITQDQYDCAIGIVNSGEPNLLIDGLMAGKIDGDLFGQLLQCAPSKEKIELERYPTIESPDQVIVEQEFSVQISLTEERMTQKMKFFSQKLMVIGFCDQILYS
ncbi:MAG: hypothetical protein GY801_04265 [bacterium]|nr:hypothetical protein [bacterium]